MCRELVANVLNMFENFMRIFSPKYFARLSCDGRATFVRVSRTCRRKILANLQYEIFATLVLVRMSHNGRATVLRQHAKPSRQSDETDNNTIARQSRDIFSKLDRNSRICRIKVYSVRLQHESCVYVVNLCREIIAN